MNIPVLCILAFVFAIPGQAHSSQKHNGRPYSPYHFIYYGPPDLHYCCYRDDKCIRTCQFCDQFRDCLYGEDEINCPFVCPDGQYKCSGEKKCIENSKMCDRTPDCLHRDDELNCAYNNEDTCPTGQRKCNGEDKCIYITQVCDQSDDCEDGGDESNCGSAATAICPDVWVTYRGSSYCFSTNEYNFDDAVAFCNGLGENIVTIEGSLENDFLKTFFETQRPDDWWIGIERDATGNLRWISNPGEDPTFLNWGTNQPGQNNDCVNMANAFDYNWRTRNCENAITRTVCERPA